MEEDFGRLYLQLLPLSARRGDGRIQLKSPEVASPSSSFGRQLAEAAAFGEASVTQSRGHMMFSPALAFTRARVSWNTAPYVFRCWHTRSVSSGPEQPHTDYLDKASGTRDHAHRMPWPGILLARGSPGLTPKRPKLRSHKRPHFPTCSGAPVTRGRSTRKSPDSAAQSR